MKKDKATLTHPRDTSKRRRAEETLRTNEEQLEKKVALRTEELKQANKELEAFSYTVSHDLRAPLRLISGYSKMLMDKKFDQMDEEGRGYLKVINKSIVRMSELIDYLLNFSRVKDVQLEKIEADMNVLVNEVVTEAKLFSNYSHTEIKVHYLQPVQCDQSLIRQVWVNLISNALKYSARNEHAQIDIGCKKDGDKTVYYIKDNGVGFDMKHVDQIFKVFKRLHSESDFEGTGVGLAFVCRIISRHKGRIWVDAKPGGGATFFFTLHDDEL